MVTVWDDGVEVPAVFETVSVTVNEPEVLNVWLGFLLVEVDASPKLHCALSHVASEPCPRCALNRSVSPTLHVPPAPQVPGPEYVKLMLDGKVHGGGGVPTVMLLLKVVPTESLVFLT